MSRFDDYSVRIRRETEDRDRIRHQACEAEDLRQKHWLEEQLIEKQRREEDINRANFLRQELFSGPPDVQSQKICHDRQEEDWRRHIKQQDELRELDARHRAMEDLIWKSREKEDGLS